MSLFCLVQVFLLVLSTPCLSLISRHVLCRGGRCVREIKLTLSYDPADPPTSPSPTPCLRRSLTAPRVCRISVAVRANPSQIPPPRRISCPSLLTPAAPHSRIHSGSSQHNHTTYSFSTVTFLKDFQLPHPSFQRGSVFLINSTSCTAHSPSSSTLRNRACQSVEKEMSRNTL
ncbi:hypothetical protein E2C01_068309 [Portunus trituberculatus]|uniref:Secreted protein n=1 Tax=Portunus trituberculatus TaxID=210409 RepID=A0A5B7HW55_PORTR|nr:hypothetical protein [Portunus trituberculatus]